MLLQLLLTPIFLLIGSLISFIPQGYNVPAWGSYFVSFVAKGLMFFPSSCFLIITANIMFWMSAHMVWAIIEWCYKKIPGVN